MPDLFKQDRLLLVTEPWLLVEGKLQNVDNVIHVLAKKVTSLSHRTDAAPSHNFH
jgi:error-prone DNA polymerase